MILRHIESVIILRYSKAVLHCISFCPDANVDLSYEADQPLFQPSLSPTVSGRRFFIRRTWRLRSTVSFWFIEIASVQKIF